LIAPDLSAATPEEFTEKLTYLFKRLAQGHDKELLSEPEVGQPYLDMTEFVPDAVGEWETDMSVLHSFPGENVAWVGRSGNFTAVVRIMVYVDQQRVVGMLQVSGEPDRIFPLDF